MRRWVVLLLAVGVGCSDSPTGPPVEEAPDPAPFVVTGSSRTFVAGVLADGDWTCVAEGVLRAEGGSDSDVATLTGGRRTLVQGATEDEISLDPPLLQGLLGSTEIRSGEELGWTINTTGAGWASGFTADYEFDFAGPEGPGSVAVAIDCTRVG